jgi:hypothetical protein
MKQSFKDPCPLNKIKDIDTIRSKMVPTQNENAQTCVAA